MALKPADLSPLEQTFLAVVAAGLVPSGLAGGDPTFRLDHVTAVCQALREGREPAAYLAPDGTAADPAFQQALREAAVELERKGVIGFGGPPAAVVPLAGADQEPPRRDPAAVDFNQAPKVFDRFLSHECLDALMREKPAYHYLMERYAQSSEIWQQLARQGYTDRRL